jgi:hypothetical protein
MKLEDNSLFFDENIAGGELTWRDPGATLVIGLIYVYDRYTYSDPQVELTE